MKIQLSTKFVMDPNHDPKPETSKPFCMLQIPTRRVSAYENALPRRRVGL